MDFELDDLLDTKASDEIMAKNTLKLEYKLLTKDANGAKHILTSNKFIKYGFDIFVTIATIFYDEILVFLIKKIKYDSKNI